MTRTNQKMIHEIKTKTSSYATVTKNNPIEPLINVSIPVNKCNEYRSDIEQNSGKEFDTKHAYTANDKTANDNVAHTNSGDNIKDNDKCKHETDNTMAHVFTSQTNKTHIDNKNATNVNTTIMTVSDMKHLGTNNTANYKAAPIVQNKVHSYDYKRKDSTKIDYKVTQSQSHGRTNKLDLNKGQHDSKEHNIIKTLKRKIINLFSNDNQLDVSMEQPNHNDIKIPEIDEFTEIKPKVRTYSYHIRNIDPETSEADFHEQLCNGSVTPTHILMYNTGTNGKKSAKINVKQRDVFKVENRDFWPKPIQCRRWVHRDTWYDTNRYHDKDPQYGPNSYRNTKTNNG